MASRQQNVVRLDIAVHDAMLMRMGERVDHLAENPHRVVYRQLAVPGEPLPQRLPLDVRHDVVEEPVRFP